MKNRIILLFGFFLILANGSFSQGITDSIPDLKKSPKHSPRIATIMSAALPGLGQAYNKKYWKMPIIYAGFAGLGYAIHYNTKYYKLYKRAYINIVDDDPNTTNPFEGTYSGGNLLELQTFHQRNRDLAWIISGVLYILNIVDASVDAHLYSFDVSDNLSMKVMPVSTPAYGQKFGVPGIGICLKAK